MMLQALYFPEFESSVLSISDTIDEIERLAMSLAIGNKDELKKEVVKLSNELRGEIITLMLKSAKIGKRLESER